VLPGLIWRSMPDRQPSLERFARGLKQRVSRPTPTAPRSWRSPTCTGSSA